MVDLHVHSNYSDGTYTPSELINYAIEKNLTAFALTDHDTVDGLAEAFSYVTALQQEKGETEDHLKRPDGKYLFTGKIVCGVCGRTFCRKKANAGTAYSAAAWVCNGYATIGKKACASRRVPEKVLVPIVAGLLRVEDEAMPAAVSRLSAMTIFPDGRLEAMIDGKLQTTAWGNASRRDSWDETRRKRASEQMKETWKRRKAE